MKISKPVVCRPLPLVLLAAFACAAPVVAGESLRLISEVPPAQSPPGGGGDSLLPIVSANSRFVAFASTANNLVTNSSGAPIPMRIPPSLNVYLHDRLYGTNLLVSVNTSGLAGGNGDSTPAGVSPDGRYVLFESSASDLIQDDTNAVQDVFVRDLSTGSTHLVSSATNGFAGNGVSRGPAMTPDGRFVAFTSAANNLVPGDTNRIADVFVRDLQAGTTVLASAGAISTTLFGSSESPDITSDGRFVAFYSTATNLVSGTRAGSDIYIRDLSQNRTLLASVYARTAVPSNSVSCFTHKFSADGRYLAYEAAGTYASSGTILRYAVETGVTDVVATNAAVSRANYDDIQSLDIDDDGTAIAFISNFGTTDGTTTCIKLWDAQSGSSRIVSGNLSDSGVPPGSVCDWPALDATGRYVAFLSSSTNVVTNAITGEFHLYLHDAQNSRTILLNSDTNGIGWPVSPATAPFLSADARSVAFESADGNLAPNDRNRALDVFLRGLEADRIELISAHDPTLTTRTPNGPCTLSPYSLSADGRYVAFASEADTLVPNDTNSFRDIFVCDLAGVSSFQLVSADTNGLPANGTSAEPAISADGRFVAFTTLADNLLRGDTNRNQDVYVRNLQTGSNLLVSVARPGFGSANGASYSPVISSNGRFIMFRSKATNLAPGVYTSGSENLFVRDLQLPTNYCLTTTGIKAASMTPDGRLVALAETFGAASGKFQIWDSTRGAVISTNSALLGLMPIAISPDARHVAYWAGSGALQLYVFDLQTGTTQAIIQGPSPTPSASILFSGNSQVLAYNKLHNGTNQVYAYDLQSGANVLVSSSFATGGPANANSDSPAISFDGRFVAYRSAASDIVPGDVNDVPDIFLFDRSTGTTALLSSGSISGGSADNRSLMPVFSADGDTLVFESWASDLVANDFNGSCDLFGRNLLALILTPPQSPAKGPLLSWPWSPTQTYKVEYKDNLSAPMWTELTGAYTNLGVRTFLEDATPVSNQRFYRVRVY